jgi:hypothetical protein
MVNDNIALVTSAVSAVAHRHVSSTAGITAGTAGNSVGSCILLAVNQIHVIVAFNGHITTFLASLPVLSGIIVPFQISCVMRSAGAGASCLSLDGDYADEHGSDQCKQHSHYSIVHKVCYYLLHCCPEITGNTIA